VQRTKRLAAAFGEIGGFSGGSGLVKEPYDHGVELPIDCFDALDEGADHFGGREVSASDAPRKLGGPLGDDVRWGDYFASSGSGLG
jgi:hypothetical protein